jgi:transcriptional regulator with XRE-family HTH domain
MYEKIKRLAKKNGISIPALEKKLHLSNGSISKWRKSTPSVTNAKKVADYFGIKIEDLI